MLYISAVSAIIAGSMTPEEILERLPYSDGLLYQAEKWRQDGLLLKRRTPGEVIEATKYFG